MLFIETYAEYKDIKLSGGEQKPFAIHLLPLALIPIFAAITI